MLLLTTRGHTLRNVGSHEIGLDVFVGPSSATLCIGHESSLRCSFFDFVDSILLFYAYRLLALFYNSGPTSLGSGWRHGWSVRA